MGKNSQPAPTPDPLIGQAALKQAQLGEDWLSFSREAFAISQSRQVELDAITKEVSQLQINTGNTLLRRAEEDRQRYDTTFKPIEDQFVKEASEYGNADRQEAAAATAQADVQSAASTQKAVAGRQMAALGIAPTSGRYAGIDRAGEAATTLGAADAGNRARTMTRDKGLALKGDVANLGRGLPAMAAQGVAQGLGAGAGGIGLIQNANAQSMAATGMMEGGFRGAMGGYGAQANTLQNLHNSNVDVWRTQEQMRAQSAAGIGSAIGGLFGLFASDENIKDKKTKVKDGKGLAAINEMRIDEWNYKPEMGDPERHIGTYAQDFKKATGKGNGKTIPVIDAIGISMKAIQDLSTKVDKMSKSIGIKPHAKPHTKPASKPAKKDKAK